MGVGFLRRIPFGGVEKEDRKALKQVKTKGRIRKEVHKTCHVTRPLCGGGGGENTDPGGAESESRGMDCKSPEARMEYLHSMLNMSSPGRIGPQTM